MIYGRPTIIFGEVLRTPPFGFGECEIEPGLSKIRQVHHITSICLVPVRIYACRRSGGLQLTTQVYCQAGKSSGYDNPNEPESAKNPNILSLTLSVGWNYFKDAKASFACLRRASASYCSKIWTDSVMHSLACSIPPFALCRSPKSR